MNEASSEGISSILEQWRGRQIVGILDSLNGDSPADITAALGSLTDLINSTGWEDGDSILDLDIPWGD